MDSIPILRCRRLCDGKGRAPVDFRVEVVQYCEILGIGVEGELDLPKGVTVNEVTIESGTFLPGLRARSKGIHL